MIRGDEAWALLKDANSFNAPPLKGTNTCS
jgi:hypothetical protein